MFVDHFLGRGGMERLAITMATFLQADIYTTYVDWDAADKELHNLNVYETGLLFKGKHYSKFSTRSEVTSRFLRLRAPNYDAYLLYGFYCLAGFKHKPNLWYTPAVLEYIYDKYEHAFVTKYLAQWQRPIFNLWTTIYKQLDQIWVKNVDQIIANSTYTQNNIKQYYARRAPIIYEGIETHRFSCIDYEDFILVASRLVKEKRIDLIIQAFKELPERTLLIAGDGPDRHRLSALASGCDNIQFLGSISYQDLLQYYARCTATIGMSISDSFPLVPLESMASGKPSIGANSTGYKESIIHGQTGLLVQPRKADIIEAVKQLTPEVARTMKQACVQQAAAFDVTVFRQHMKTALARLIKH